ncbi:hypothetical protein C427_2005 [Paraglaciecola psychrophila 170]|uniref:Uncharacterized protein n=1 Tax=Paraglaciecola psychrophila 170 TaxID=1129794 RepID=K7AZI7_9ALTE|nr:hypothetical protein C427_2005 [Paraglaciecola psychrophila 170]GAC40480.1 hypothetical protein GPSY_4879 [Paraglaciecola psychrophila 170]
MYVNLKQSKACADAYWRPARRSLASFDSNPFEPVTFLQQLKKSNQKKATRGQRSSSGYFVN